MSSTEGRPTDEEDGPDESLGFGDALAELAVEDAPEVDPVDAVRESREDVWGSSSIRISSSRSSPTTRIDPISHVICSTAIKFYSSIYNVMEVRNVLTTKYHFKRDRIEEVEKTIRTYADPVSHSSVLIQPADEIQEATYTTAMDAIMLAGADHIDGTLVTFDTELHRRGAKPPEEIQF